MAKLFKNKYFQVFTLLEVVIALAIFGMGLIGALTLVGSAARRIDSAVKRWERQHYLSQAAEYLIIKGFDDSSIPDAFFPTHEYRIRVEVGTPDELPEDIEMEDSKWQLKKITLTLCDSTGKDVDYIEFDRLIYDENKK